MRKYASVIIITGTAAIIFVSILLIGFPRPASAQTFTSVSHNLPRMAYGATCWGDYDNDGDLDLLLTGLNFDNFKRESKIYRNDNGSFADIHAGLPDTYTGSAAWGDYDNDGDLDLVLDGWNDINDQITVIYRNDGGGNFVDIGAGLLGMSSGAVCWGDYDNDGDLDLLLQGLAPYPMLDTTLIYRNDGNDTFASTSIALPALTGGSLDWGDYDNDGDLDILITGKITPIALTTIYRNDGNDIFTDIDPGFFGLYAGQGKWGDYDQDGDLDILVDGSDSLAAGFLTFVYRNDGGEAFTNINAAIAGAGEGSSLGWGDCDNDGDFDVALTADTISQASIYHFDGGTTFTRLDAGLLGGCCGGMGWADYDNDGDLDLLMNLTIFDSTRLYRNENPIADTPPVAPSGLQSSVDSNTVTLSWDAANDAETLSPGLTYNIRIGSYSGGVDVMSPMADIATGYRKIVAMGNVNQNLSWTIKNLPDGIYYWSVQTIDNAFVGSAFAPEATFSVGEVTYLCGDANGDEALNVGDAVFIVNFVFKGGAAPVPVEAGDANCDGATNVGDAVYLINYAFSGGPQPCCP